MIDHKVPLNSLKFFYYVAEFGSVSLAAEKLYLTQSAVSKQIKSLEQALMLQLFDRINKSLVLTNEGRILYVCCQQIFGQLQQCLGQIQHSTVQNKALVLSCEPTLSMKWLIPRLATVHQLNWGFEVILQTGGGPVDFKEQQIDLALRRNDFEWGTELYSEKLADEYMVLVQGQHSQIKRKLLWSRSRPHFDKQLRKYESITKRIPQSDWIALEHFYLCIEGCLAGWGETLLSIYMVEKELTYQTLQPVIPIFSDHSAYYLLSAAAFDSDPRKMVFMQWLQQEMLKTQQQFVM
ncbi:LysR family transcriptional regulator [Acinetobacter rudis]|uniref:LysR family transcriptional regulator n=1 Tax=Acinetobacter rudis TaxID=632955 RepID=A0AAW8JAT6_9GAMM|nr:LysR family transcriptional regulator [Acinetobacter rudis]MDQ8936949.1 LysR family transcriptional regulator [Acinetobacter rudis]MDQ9019169.1 LysR family transcriptional regulator [Acinetobacter rudis]